MTICKEACQFLKKIKDRNWLGVLADLIEDESQDMQKYVWLSEMADGNKDLEALFEVLAYCEHVHGQKLLHPMFAILAKEQHEKYGKPSSEQTTVWNQQHAMLMSEHKAAFNELAFADLFEAEAAKYELLSKLCTESTLKSKLVQIYTFLKGVK